MRDVDFWFSIDYRMQWFEGKHEKTCLKKIVNMWVLRSALTKFYAAKDCLKSWIYIRNYICTCFITWDFFCFSWRHFDNLLNRILYLLDSSPTKFCRFFFKPSWNSFKVKTSWNKSKVKLWLFLFSFHIAQLFENYLLSEAFDLKKVARLNYQ